MIATAEASDGRPQHRNKLHYESWAGLRQAGVYAEEQEVDVGRRHVLNKLNMLNKMSSTQIEKYQILDVAAAS